MDNQNMTNLSGSLHNRQVDCNESERDSLERMSLDDSRQQQFQNVDFTAAERKMVIVNLPESFVAEEAKRAASDWDAVCQILVAIDARPLLEKVQSVEREGTFDLRSEHPRCVIVTFADVFSRDVAIDRGTRLAAFPQMRLVVLHAYSQQPMTENRQNLGGMWNQENPAANEQHGMPGRFPYPRSGGPHYTQQSMSPPHPHENPYNARQGPYGTQYVVAPPFTATSPPGQPPFQHPNPHGQYESFANMFPPGSIPTSAPPGYQQHQQLPNNFTPAGQNGYPQNFYGQQQCDPNGTIPNSQNPHAAFWPQMGYGQQNPTNGQASGTAGPQGMPFFPQQPQQHQTFPQNPTFPIGNSQPDITAFAEHLKSKQESTTPPTFVGQTPEKKVTKEKPKETKETSESEESEEESEQSEESFESEEGEGDEEIDETPQITNKLFAEQSKKQKRDKTVLNILVLGETGVGKSTWINGMANYLEYESLEDALQASKPICLIPSQFPFYEAISRYGVDVKLHPTNGKNDENEVFSDKGQSATQEPRTYKFETPKYILNIIDTPGIGDTRGIEQDRENTRKILSAIGQYTHLHAICLLFKANHARLTPNFHFCVSELMLQLHKDAVNNFVFFFTNSRGSMYSPGDTITPLRAFLKELGDKRRLHIKLTKENMYCTDNEAFRLVCAHANGIHVDDATFSDFAESWNKSADETHRFIEFAAKQIGHETQSTVSLSQVRSIIYGLAQPLAIVNELIESNISVIANSKTEIQNTDENLNELKKRLKIPLVGLEVYELDYPKTVCTDPKCIEVVQMAGTEENRVVYNQVCHDRCYLKGIDVEKVPEPHLKACSAMSGLNCRKCGCAWESHMHIRYEQKKVAIKTDDRQTRDLIEQNQNASKTKKQMLADHEKLSKEYTEEQQKLLKTSLRFASYLQENSVLPYNDAFEKYVMQTIIEEEKCTEIGGNRTKLENLQKSLAEYRQEKLMLEAARNDPNENRGRTITPNEIENGIKELFKLKHMGETIKNLYNTSKVGLTKHQKHNVVEHESPKKASSVGYGKYKNQDKKRKGIKGKERKPKQQV